MGKIVKMGTYKIQEMKGFRTQTTTRSIPNPANKVRSTAVKTGVISPGKY